ncbi:MAG: heavy-metal-associated domain-containing protein [Crocinitomicaceae bacterium]
MKTIFLTIILGFATIVFAQKPSKYQTIKIKTSAICGECEERIENKLNYSKGVKFADLDLETNIVTVRFKTKKMTSTDVKALITSIGYHADEMERDSSAFDVLPGCCQDPNAKCTGK